MKPHIRKRVQIVMLLLVLLGLVGLVSLRVVLNPSLIRRRAVDELERMLGTRVEITSASFGPLSGLDIHGLKVFVKGADGQNQLLVTVPRVEVRHRPASLFTGKLTYSQIHATGAQFHLERFRDGTFNIEQVFDALRRKPPTRQALPAVRLDDTRFFYTDHALSDDAGRPLSARIEKVHGSVTPTAPLARTFSLRLVVDDPQLGKWEIDKGSLDAEDGVLDFEADASPIRMDDRLKARIPAKGHRIWDLFNPTDGTVHPRIRLAYDRRAKDQLFFRITADIRDGVASYEYFPYEMRGLHGTLVFTEEGVEVQQLSGRSDPGVATISGRSEGYGRDAGIEMHIRMRGIPLDARLRAAFKDSQQALWDEFDPAGLIEGWARIDRDPGPDLPVRVRVLAANVPGTRIYSRYRHFSYALECEGWTFFDAGAFSIVQAPASQDDVFSDLRPGALRARHNGAELSVSGTVVNAHPEPRIDMTVEVVKDRELPLDEDLHAALPPEIRDVMDYLRPVGTIGGSIHITRADPKQKSVDLRVALDRFRNRTLCRDFPYEIEDPAGEVVYERSATRAPRGVLRINGLVAKKGDSVIGISGFMEGFREGKPPETADLAISGTNLPLDDELRRAIPPEYLAAWDYLSPKSDGRVDAFCTIRRTSPDETVPDFTLIVNSLDASIMCADFPYRVDHVKGVAEYRHGPKKYADGELRLKDLRAEDEGGRVVTVSGTLGGFYRKGEIERVHLTVEGTRVGLDAHLRAALDPDFRSTWDAFNPAGLVDVTCYLNREKDDKKLSANLFIRSLDSSIRYEHLPLDVTGIVGRLQIAEGLVRVTKMKGRAVGGAVTLDGTVRRSHDRPVFDLTFTGEDLALGRELQNVLPEGYRRFWQDLDPRGTLSLSGSVRRVWLGEDAKEVLYQGVLKPKDVSLKLGLGDVTNMSGSLRVEGAFGPEGHNLEGSAAVERAWLSGNRFDDLSAFFRKEKNILSVYEFVGKVQGGTMRAEAQFDLVEPMTYGAVADVSGLQLSKVAREFFKAKGDDLRGRVSGRVMVQGQGTNPDDCAGQAELVVSEGALWEVPVIVSLLNVLNLTPPERRAFTDAAVTFDFYDRRMMISRLDLHGRAVSIYGTGEIAPTGSLKLDFVTGISRSTLPDVPVFSPLIRLVGAQIVKVKVTGSYGDPQVEVIPVAPLTDTMKGLVNILFPGERKKKEPRGESD